MIRFSFVFFDLFIVFFVFFFGGAWDDKARGGYFANAKIVGSRSSSSSRSTSRSEIESMEKKSEKRYDGTCWQSDERVSALIASDLVFPGTHDSGTYWLSEKFQGGSQTQIPEWVKDVTQLAKKVDIPMNELVSRWAKTQKQTIFEQLRTGARYVDLRCGYQKDDGSWKVHHGLIGVDCLTVLEDVKNFLETFETEVVILEVSHFYGDPEEANVEELASMVLGTLSEFVVPYYSSDGNSTSYSSMESGFWQTPLKESVQKNERVLIAFENFNDFNTVSKHEPFLWPLAMIENSYADTDDFKKMKEFNYDVVRDFNNQTESTKKKGMQKLSWILTTQTKTVENSIWPLINNHHPKTLIDLELKYANDKKELSDFVALVVKDLTCQFPQVLSIDCWFNDPDTYWSLARDIALKQNENKNNKNTSCKALLL